jgi:hypothetical protein
MAGATVSHQTKPPESAADRYMGTVVTLRRWPPIACEQRRSAPGR